MEPQIIIYQEKNKKRWVAEVIDIDNFTDTGTAGSQLWWGVFDSKEEAREAALREMEKKAELLKVPLFQMDMCGW
jgi:hypothetical protein